MLIWELTQSEDHPAYQDLSIDNLQRQYSFLRSAITASIQINRPFLSTSLIKALNFHAICGLHVDAGQYRKGPVFYNGKEAIEHYRVDEHVSDLVNEINHMWNTTDIVFMASYALWKLNRIHPFINGNGRTARAICYYIVCTKAGKLLNGDPQLPELIRANRKEYVSLLDYADKELLTGNPHYLMPLCVFISRLVNEQLSSIESKTSPPDTGPDLDPVSEASPENPT
jgi:Fic family protein